MIRTSLDLLNQIEAGKIGIHTFTNVSEYSIGETDVRIISIEFASKEENHAQFFGQVVVDVAADSVARSVNASGTIVIPFPSAGSGAAEGNDGTGDGPSGTEPEAGDTEDGAAGEETTDISVDVSLPVNWTEDGKAVCYVTFELNNAEILLHYPVETWHSGKHILSLYYPIEKYRAEYYKYLQRVPADGGRFRQCGDRGLHRFHQRPGHGCRGGLGRQDRH